jgi:signal peptidase II
MSESTIGPGARTRPLLRRTASGIGFSAAALALALDQGHKYWMLDVYHIAERGRVAVTSFLDLVLVWNQGVSYGLLHQDSETGRLALIGFSLAMVVALTLWMVHAASRLSAFSLGLIIGGALGNAADRLVHGAVADFFSFHYAGYHWYIFNVADVAIAAGVIGLLMDWALNPASR